MRSVNTFVILTAVHFVLQAPAALKELRRSTQSFNLPADCKAAGTCKLSSANLTEIKTKVLLPGDPPDLVSIDTDVRINLSFKDKTSYKEFGVVQQIKGCLYETKLQSNGKRELLFAAAHKNFGSYRLIKYPAFQIDAEGVDPVKSAFVNHGRFDLYHWTPNGKTQDPDNDPWVFNSAPPGTEIYLADLVGFTGLKELKGDEARNSAVDFRVCLFHIKDLPKVSDADGLNIDFRKAISCLSWDHHFYYDFKKRAIIDKKETQDICSLNDYTLVD